MTIEHDPYPDLPALPLPVRLTFQDMAGGDVTSRE